MVGFVATSSRTDDDVGCKLFNSVQFSSIFFGVAEVTKITSRTTMVPNV